MVNKSIRSNLRQDPLAPFSIRDYRLLWFANVFWWQARFMEMIVIGWLVLDLTNSPWQVGLTGFYRSVPLVFFGFLTGLIIDRFGRRSMILFSQRIAFLAILSLAILLWTNHLVYWHIATAAIIMGTAWAVDWPARRSLIPDLVGKSKTVDAMLLEGFGQTLARMSGPFLAGWLIAQFAPKGAFASLAIIMGVTLLLLGNISKQPIPRNTRPGSSSPLTDILDGLRYMRQNQAVLGVILVTVVMNFFSFPYMTLLPVFARDVLGQGAAGLGQLGAMSGIGAFIGILLINRVRRSISYGWIFVGGSFLQSLALICFSYSDNFRLSSALLILVGIGQACFGSMQSGIILLNADDSMRSRAMGLVVLGISTGPFGQLLIGALAENFGAPAALLIQSLCSACGILAITIVLPIFRQTGEQFAS